ncbi:hypothetical protein [Bdellovibrio sp. KM01]|uniref:hypothetical protein n=1 Tax=Bdellovibrio sp. KM01 TaxID=2748865 RepID=UPI0015EA6782|nr:hypothetical protein [Bdellovibrio sp. KM01]QLY25166.1 hypothetical protein HW988_17375 [Bdellovibrio sp. KM01]
MKHLVLASLLILGASTSHAVVADKFTCTAKIKDRLSGTESTQSQELSVVRLPSSGGTTKPFDETMGQTQMKIKIDAKHGTAFANLNFYYSHASREIPGATGIEARQFTCMGVAGGYCKHKNDGGPIQPCYDDGQVACMQSNDPFSSDPVTRWKKTSVNGKTPVFNDDEMGPASMEITDDVTGQPLLNVDISCKFLGTYK